MAEKSLHRQGTATTLQHKDPQFDEGRRKLRGFNFQVISPVRYSRQTQLNASPPQTPRRIQHEHTQSLLDSPPSNEETRRAPKTPVVRIEEEHPTYKTMGWTPPGLEDTASGNSVVYTCMLEEKTPPNLLSYDYYKALPQGLTNQQRMTQLLIWSLRHEFDQDKPPSSSSPRLVIDGKIIAHKLKLKFMEELAKGNIVLQEVYPYSQKQSVKREKNRLKREALEQRKRTLEIFAQELQGWEKFESKLNDRMAKFFEEKASEKQTIPVSVNRMDDHLSRLDPLQVQYYRKHIKNTQPNDIKLNEFDISELPTLMRQSLNTTMAFKKLVGGFERDAMDDLIKRTYKRSRIIPDDDEIPSVLDKDARKSKEIQTTEKIIQLFVQQNEKKNQPE